MQLGSDTSTGTTAGTTGVYNPLGSPTNCTSISGSSWTSGNDYFVSWNGLWAPGSISGTVGEIGLFCFGETGFNSAAATYQADGSYLASRFSSADGEFTQFAIDTTKPVVVVWTFKYTTDLKLLNIATCNLAGFTSANLFKNYLPSYGWTSKNSYMVIGSNTTTGNTASMANLVAPIGTSPGTKPNTQSIANANPSPGVYNVTYTGTWNAGTVSGTCGEIGLYLYGLNSLSAFGSDWNLTTVYLWLRLCHADGHFTAFTINASNNLTLAVTITFTFA